MRRHRVIAPSSQKKISRLLAIPVDARVDVRAQRDGDVHAWAVAWFTPAVDAKQWLLGHRVLDAGSGLVEVADVKKPGTRGMP